MDSVLASHPVAPGSILGTPVPRFIVHCLVSGQWYSNEPIWYEAGVRKSSCSWYYKKSYNTRKNCCYEGFK